MLHVHRSHHLEALAEALGAVMRAPLRSALATEIVVVQSLGMRRWLALDLAQGLGVAMNVRFPFPAGFAQEVFRAAFPDTDADAGWQRERLPWRILAAFPRMLAEPGWEELRGYVEGDHAPLKAYQLALRIAAIFDRYLAYRPEMLLEWQTSRRAHDWQAQLWRELVKGRQDSHPPALLHRLQERTPSPLPGLPERLSIFGISSLPPLYLHLIANVARALEVHLFLLEPTDQYWGDTLSAREQDRRLRDRETSPEDEHYDAGNPLLSSFGKVGREFTRLVQDLEPVSSVEYFGDAPGGRRSVVSPIEPAKTGTRQSVSLQGLLHRVQAGIFELRERGAEEREIVAADDPTIQVHCCHGPMREVEVLHDQLLDLFERIPGLTPRDILVAVPDIEACAPFIEAVFGSPEDPRHAIPFTVADRTARAGSSVADAFLRLLDLRGSRFTAPSVLALLECPAVRARFELGEGDLATIRAWVVQTGIRWGIDADHRASLGLPPFRENTWRAGLERLLLGYALPGDGCTLFHGLLPLREVEGALALTLGRFVEFAEALFAKVPALAAPRPLPQWEHACRDLLHTFFDDGDDFADEVRRLRETFATLSHTAADAEFAEPVAFEVLRAHLGGAFADTDSGLGFLAGAVTFCALKPMRAIPFQVICLLGMNDTAFPRRDPGLAFDRVASEPRRGDRSQRDDDRYLFLEAILSARAVLYLSYSGLSPRDNTAAPPSVVVSELLDYLDDHYALASGKLRETLVTRHRLQPFSPAYFGSDARLFSYSADNAHAAAASLRPRAACPAFAATPLAEPGAEWLAVELDQLAEFFAHPAKFFARNRLRLALPEECAPLEECEPLELTGLPRYGLDQELTARALSGAPPAGHLPIVRAGGLLPHGYPGDSELGAMSCEAEAFAARIRPFLSAPPLPPRSIDATLGEWRLTGTLHGLYETAQLRHRSATLKAKDFLRAWIHHLALQLDGGAPRETLLFGRDTAWRFPPLDNPRPTLADLLALYRSGLQSPLPLFPNTSLEYARRTLQPSEREKADPIVEARKKWDADENRPGAGEQEDRWFQRCFPPDPLDAHWQEIARRVFGPILAARQEVKA